MDSCVNSDKSQRIKPITYTAVVKLWWGKAKGTAVRSVVLVAVQKNGSHLSVSKMAIVTA